MPPLRKKIREFIRNAEGLELVEYAIMAALIVAALAVAVGALLPAILAGFGAISDIITGS